MGWGFIGIIRSWIWMLSEGGEGVLEYGMERTRMSMGPGRDGIWLGGITTSMDAR